MIFTGTSPIVSIITPVYNSLGYIDRVIDTALCQNVALEHIFIDDFSSDGTFEYLCNLNKLYSHIIVLRNDSNCGPSFSRNRGIRIASGKFLAFLDVDDLWLPSKLFLQMKFMKQKNYLVSCTGFRKMSSDFNFVSKVITRNKDLSYLNHLSTRYVCCSSILINKEALGDFAFPVLNRWMRVDDFFAWSLLFNKTSKIGFLSNDLVRYTVGVNSRSSNRLISVFSVIYLYIFFEKANFFTITYSFISYLFFSLYKKFFFRINLIRNNIDL